MKVLVLGIDGLEYELVNRWDIKVYKQSYYGKIDVRVAVRSGDPLYTPLIWGSFLLGKPSYLFGLSMEEIKEKRVRSLYGKFYFLFKLRKKFFGDRNLHLRGFLTKIGLANLNEVIRNTPMIETLPPNVLKYTFIAEAEERGYRVFYTEFPALKESRYAEMRACFSRYFTMPLDKKLSKLEEVFEYSSKLLSKTISVLADYDLLLYYTSVIDYAHHMLYRPTNLRYMVALYSIYKRLADLLAESIPENDDLCTLIISDHGYNPVKQEHSDYGFWSLNIKPPKTPRTILDMKDIILKFLNKETDKMTFYSTDNRRENIC